MADHRFLNRATAGQELARHLSRYRHRSDVLVLGLPRGGVPVAAAVASELGAPLDVFLVRKLGVPGKGELAFGAIAEGGVKVLSAETMRQLAIPAHAAEEVAVRERGSSSAAPSCISCRLAWASIPGGWSSGASHDRARLARC
jgi:predicted phosphoribosyltransferase